MGPAMEDAIAMVSGCKGRVFVSKCQVLVLKCFPC